MKKIIFILSLFSFVCALDYALEDVNDTSPTFGEVVGPSYFQSEGKVISINYFGWENWGGWRGIFAQLCNLSNEGAWDTDKAVFIGIGIGAGGDTALNGMINPDGNDSPWVQDVDRIIWEDFLGDANAPRKQVVLLDNNLEPRAQFAYSGGSLNDSEVAELLDTIAFLVNEASMLGDMNGDQNLNVLDVIILVNMALGNIEIDLNGDINSDNGINILDVVLLVNIILSN